MRGVAGAATTLDQTTMVRHNWGFERLPPPVRGATRPATTGAVRGWSRWRSGRSWPSTRSSPRTSCPVLLRASGKSSEAATRRSRASPPTSASTTGRRSPSRSTTTAKAPYHIDIYRMGYYQGNGARLVTTIPSSQTAGSGPARPPHRPDDRAGRRRQLVGLRLLGRPARTPPRASTSRTSSRDDTGGASQIYLRRPRRRAHLGHPVPDLR